MADQEDEKVKCSHQSLYGFVVVTQKRSIHLNDRGYWETDTSSDREIDWSTSCMQCENCDTEVPYAEMNRIAEICQENLIYQKKHQKPKDKI